MCVCLDVDRLECFVGEARLVVVGGWWLVVSRFSGAEGKVKSRGRVVELIKWDRRFFIAPAFLREP